MQCFEFNALKSVRVEIEKSSWQEPLVDHSFSKTFAKSQSSGPRTVDNICLAISFKLQGVVLWFSEGGDHISSKKLQATSKFRAPES